MNHFYEMIIENNQQLILDLRSSSSLSIKWQYQVHEASNYGFDKNA